MRLTAIVLLVSAGGAPAQRPVPAGAADAQANTVMSKGDTALLSWRNGLEISVNAGTWDRSLTDSLANQGGFVSERRCPQAARIRVSDLLRG